MEVRLFAASDANEITETIMSLKNTKTQEGAAWGESAISELERLVGMFEKGLISGEKFENLKTRLI